MISNKTLSPYTKNIWLVLFVLILFGISFGIYVYSEKNIDRANQLQLQSFILADELRQSSDDLTRMVRTYAATQNPLYKQHYQEILEIRNGNKVRPIDYQNIYWDLVSLDDKRPRAYSEQSIPLIEMMRKTGFTQNEFIKLSEAKDNSDALTKTELTAMRFIEMKGSNLEIQNNKQKALEMLFDENYHKAKTSIMLPIDEFSTLVKKRTEAMIYKAEMLAFYLRIVFISVGFFLAFMLWRLYKTIYRILGTHPDLIYGHISRIGKGDFSVEIAVEQEIEDSVLGWLGKTQIELKKMIAKNKRLTQLYAALSQCNQAIVRSKNEAELFPSVCRDVVNFGGMKMASIGIANEQKKEIKSVAMYGERADEIDSLTVSLDPEHPLGQTPCSRAFNENRDIWCQDLLNDPTTKPCHANGKKYGWGSCAILPLHRKGKAIGVFAIYSEAIGAFDEAAQRLLKEMVMDISYALDSFDRDAARENAENALAESNNLLESIINTAPLRIFWKDKNLNYLGCNQVFANDAGGE